ncbi:MAG: hypothetical protein ACLFR1_06405 [Spirochaetia bacterium]
MTLEANKTLDSLLIHYPESDFLINWYQCTSSMYIDKTFRLRSSFAYLNHAVTYGNENVLLFDLDQFLQDTFALSPQQNEAKLALISHTENLSQETRDFYHKFVNRSKSTKFSSKYIAYKVCIDTETNRFPVSELSPYPPKIRDQLMRMGILGVRLISEKHVQMFIDLEFFLTKKLLTKRKTVDESIAS